MSLRLLVGKPSFSSTPKRDNSSTKYTISNFEPYSSKAMENSQLEVKKVNLSSGSKSVQRTVVEKSYTTSGSRSYGSESKVVPSSYQLRFGARGSRGYGYANAGYRRGASIEASVTRVTVNDGLQLTPTLITSRAEEKAELGALNDRFVTYIDKVRGLVSRNQLLEAKVKQLESSRIIPSKAGDMYEAHLHELQKDLEQVITSKTQVEIELESCHRELDDINKKLQREIEDRKDAENEAKSLCKDVDQATLIRVELEGKVESLREELDLVRRANDEDIRVLTEQLAAMGSGEIIVDGSQQTDLSESLRDIRAAYEQLTQNNKFDIESYFKTKIADLSSQLKDESTAHKGNKSELIDIRRQMQSVTVELESLRTSNAALENQLEDSENRYHTDIENHQQIIGELEAELNMTKDKVQRQLVDYNELLNLKLSLDLEIQTYRKLLEGEESRISVHGGHSSEIEVNVVEKVVTVVEKETVRGKGGRRGSASGGSSSSSSSSSDSESEI